MCYIQEVHDCESSVHAADLIEDIALREKINKNQLVIHSDNGSPMKGATLRAKMIDPRNRFYWLSSL
jgi:hypothetical protein